MVKGADGKHKLAMDHGVVLGMPARHRVDRFLAVDPGGVHVGLAEFARKPGGVWYVEWAGEKTPEEFLLFLHNGLRKMWWRFLVVEEWKLFPEEAPRSVGSDMPTSRLIGAIQALARFSPPNHGWLEDAGGLPVIYQSPKIKVPTRSWLKRRKLRSVAKMLKVAGDHATDAELHGYHYLVRAEEPVWNVNAQNTFSPPLTPGQDLW